MLELFKKFKLALYKCADYLVVLAIALISVGASVHFFIDNKILLYGDALSRLNIARKIFDNLTPGFAQLGNVWLPLPQLMMLPFVTNDFLWHSGIAGTIVSSTAFVIGAFYLYKSMRILSGSIVSSVLALSVFVFNINLLYLQSTAMSESIFLCSICAAIYYFLKWIKTKDKLYLVPAAMAVSAATVIRYEALAVLASSILMVFVYTWIRDRKYRTAEGNTIAYAFLACLGFGVWTLYLAAIFGDPLYWQHYYTATHVVGEGTTQLNNFTLNISFVQATLKYFIAVIWMNGLIPFILAILALPVLLFRSIKQKSFYFLPVLISLSMFLFMILTLERNTPIDQPHLSLQTILSPETSRFLEFNIRYGLLMLPMITLLISYLFSIRSKIFKVIILLILSVQFYSYFSPKYTVIYQLPISINDNITQGMPKEKAMVAWMQQNYDGGYIMISALKHDPQMLEMGLNYRTYIHEGAGRYWKESIKDPQRYATWVIFDSWNKDDQVTKYLSGSGKIDMFYNKVYDNEGMYIYKIKTHPDIIIPGLPVSRIVQQ